jgi:hypothetical protein
MTRPAFVIGTVGRWLKAPLMPVATNASTMNAKPMMHINQPMVFYIMLIPRRWREALYDRLAHLSYFLLFVRE